jgi:hypothetical protein
MSFSMVITLLNNHLLHLNLKLFFRFYVIFQEIRHANYDKNGGKNATNNITQHQSFNKIEQFLFPLGTGY